MSGITACGFPSANAGSTAPLQANNKENAAEEQFDAAKWNPVLQLPGYKPYVATIPLDCQCPFIAKSLKEHAVHFVKEKRRYFIAMLDCGKSKTICDADAVHRNLKANFTDPLTRQTVLKVHYFVSNGNPVFQHFVTCDKRSVSNFMSQHILANSLGDGPWVQEARFQLLNSYCEAFGKLSNESERKLLDQELVQSIMPGFQETEVKINMAEIQQNFDAEFLHLFQLILNDEPKNSHVKKFITRFLLDSPVLRPKRREAVINRLGHHPNVLGILAFSYYADRDWVKAEELLRAIVKSDDTLVDSHADIGGCLGLQGRVDEGVQYLNQVLKKNPSHKDVGFLHGELAVLFARKNQLKEALEHALEAFREVPNWWLIANVIAVVYFRKNEIGLAEYYADEALKLKSANFDALVTKANCARKKGAIKEAEDHLDSAVAVAADVPFLGHFGLPYYKECQGELHRVKKQFSLAKRFLGDALKEYGNFPSSEIYQYLAKLAIDENDMKEAHENLEKSAKLNDENGETHALLGKVLGELGRLPEEKAHLKRTLELNFHTAEVYFSLGKILKKEKKLEEARDAFTEAVKLEKKVVYLNALGETHELLNEIDKAKWLFELSISKELVGEVADKNDFAHAHLGRILLLSGDLSNAKEHLDLALSINKNNDVAMECLENLYAMKAKALSLRRLQLQQDGKAVAAKGKIPE